jgi:hypothetical protein
MDDCDRDELTFASLNGSYKPLEPGKNNPLDKSCNARLRKTNNNKEINFSDRF